MKLTIEDKYQKIDENLSSGLSVSPEFLREYFTSNIVNRVLSYLLGWDYYTGLPVKISCESDGKIRVSSYSSVGSINDTKTGITADSWSIPIPFDNIASSVDIWAWDNALELQRSIDGVTWQDTIEIPANSSLSFNAVTHSIRVKSKTSGQSSRYQIIGWF